MADITRGHTYGVNDTVTNTNLHSLVDSATIANIASADFNLSTTNPAHVGSTAPSDSNSKMWIDTTNNLFLIKDASGTFQPVGRGHYYTNKSGGSLAAGDVVVLDTANATAVKTTTSAVDTDAWGVAAITAANNAEVYVITEGYVVALTVTGATSIGDYLFTSTTAKKADPASTISSGAFARALTSSSTSVAAKLLGGGAVQAIAGSDTFEMEAGRNASISTTFGTPTTVTFGTAFAVPPNVVCTAESVTVSDTVTVIEVTTTNFTAYGSAAGGFNWVATTAGTFEIKTGVVIQSGTAAMATALIGSLTAYQTGKTPAIVGSTTCSEDVAGVARFACFNRMFGGGATTNLNFAGRSSGVSVYTDGNIAGNQSTFILVSQTSAVKTGNTATADGSQDTINTLSFETGTVLQTSSVTPTLTFATAFSAAPAVIVSGEGRDNGLSGGNYTACLNATPTTTACAIRGTTTDTRVGYNWIAFEKGHTVVTTAKRLG